MSRCRFGLCVHFTFVLGEFHRSLMSFCYFVSTCCIFLANCLSSHIMFWPEVTFMTFTIKDLYCKCIYCCAILHQFVAFDFFLFVLVVILLFFHHIWITALKVLTCFCNFTSFVHIVMFGLCCFCQKKPTKDPWRRNIDIDGFCWMKLWCELNPCSVSGADPRCLSVSSRLLWLWSW